MYNITVRCTNENMRLHYQTQPRQIYPIHKAFEASDLNRQANSGASTHPHLHTIYTHWHMNSPIHTPKIYAKYVPRYIKVMNCITWKSLFGRYRLLQSSLRVRFHWCIADATSAFSALREGTQHPTKTTITSHEGHNHNEGKKKR